MSAVGICFTHSCFDTRRGDRELFSGSRVCVCVCNMCVCARACTFVSLWSYHPGVEFEKCQRNVCPY